MLLLSHRGYHANAPENTIEAFEQAVEMGVDGIETDIRLSADGQAVLFHDRVSPDGREVASLSRQELSEAAGYRVPTVEEALAMFPGIFWNLEIKSRDAVEITKSIVNRVASSTRLLVTSFLHDVVEEFGRSTTAECGILIGQCPFADLDITHLLLDQKRIETIVWSIDVLDSNVIASAKQHGLRNFVYGAQTQKEHLQLMELHVDGIITDYPQFVLPK